MTEAALVARIATAFRRAGIPAGLTAQIAAVVRSAGLDAVTRLGDGVITTPQAGRVMAAYLRDAKKRTLTDAAVARELGTAAQLQTMAVDPALQTIPGAKDGVQR